MSWDRNRNRLHITFNAPVTLMFVFISLIVWGADTLMGGKLVPAIFSVYHSALSDVMTWPRFVLHIFGHSGFSHLSGNLMYILILGPMLEEKYGKARYLSVILITGFVTGVASWLFQPNVSMCGASGVVFAMILLSSFVKVREKELPLTLILVAVCFIGQQVYNWIAVGGNTAYWTHILGGAVGAVFGFGFSGRKRDYHSYHS